MAEHNGEAEMFERECRIMGMFIDNAKTYVQLSTGALLLSVTFMREILAIPKETRLPFDCWLILAWSGFLAAVMCGTYYQYLAVKFLEEKSGVPRSHRAWPEWLIRRPWPAYGAMLAAFYFGGICFVIAAVRQM